MLMPALVLTRMAPWWNARTRNTGTAVIGLPCSLGADIGRDRHLADVELVAAHHAAERGDDRIDLHEVELEGLGLHRAVLERLVVALGAGDGLQLGSGHGAFRSKWMGCSAGPYNDTRANRGRASSAALEAALLVDDQRALHPGRRQVVLDHLRDRLEHLELVTRVGPRSRTPPRSPAAGSRAGCRPPARPGSRRPPAA